MKEIKISYIFIYIYYYSHLHIFFFFLINIIIPGVPHPNGWGCWPQVNDKPKSIRTKLSFSSHIKFEVVISKWAILRSFKHFKVYIIIIWKKYINILYIYVNIYTIFFFILIIID